MSVRVLIEKKLIFRRQEKNPREQRSGNAARAWPKLLQPTKFGSDRRSAIYGRVYFPFLFLLSFQLNICRVFKYQAVISCIKLKVNHLFISLFISIKSNSRLSLQLRCGR